MRLTFEIAWEKFKVNMNRQNYSYRSIEGYEKTLKLFERWFKSEYEGGVDDLKNVNCDIILEYMDYLYSDNLSPSTVQIYMVRICLFFRFLYRNDMILEDPTRKVPKVKVPHKEIVYISHVDIMDKLESILRDSRKKGCRYDTAYRDYLIIRVAYATGWRASEALKCNVKDINWETGVIYLPKRKGNKDGYVYLDMETCHLLKDWYYSKYPNGKWLWYSARGKPLTYSGYFQVFKNVFGKGPHRIRASLATYLISQDVGIKDVADVLGHSNVSSTMRYAATIKDRIRDIHSAKNPFSK